MKAANAILSLLNLPRETVCAGLAIAGFTALIPLVLRTIDGVNRETGSATVLITHNAAIAAMADRVLRMTSGRISEESRNARRISPEELVW